MLQCLPLVKVPTIVLHCWPMQMIMFLKIPHVTFGTKCQLMKFELEFHFAYSHDDLSQKSEKITVHFLLFTDYCSLVLFIMTFYAYLRRDFP